MNNELVEKGRAVFDREIAELQRLKGCLSEQFASAVQKMTEARRGGGKVVAAGVGKSGIIAQKLVGTLNSTGFPSVVLDCQNALHGDLGVVDFNDVAVLYSYSGQTKELLQIVPHLRRLAASLIAVTGDIDSALAKACDIVLDVHVNEEACPLGLSPTSSTTASLVMSDALAMVLLEERQFTKENFAEFHPSGSLGFALLTKVSNIMRPKKDIALAPPETTVEAALVEMKNQRTGAVIVVDSELSLKGIFTQGDFARAFQQDYTDLRNLKIGELMSPNPISIEGNRLAAEALRVLEEHRVDELVVVDAENKVIGLVDTQDLARMRVV